MTSSAATTMAPPTFSSMRPAPMLYCDAHFLSTPNALITGSGMRAAGPPIGKFWSERCVCAPQSTSVLTSMGPKASLSVRVDSGRLRGSSRSAAVARRAEEVRSAIMVTRPKVARGVSLAADDSARDYKSIVR